MKVQVIGAGNVGRATGHVFRRLGHKVVFFDENPTLSTVPQPVEADFHFICTPEMRVSEAVAALKHLRGLAVIRSTTLPGQTQQMIKSFGRPICHNPCFAREKTAFADELHPHKIVIGRCCGYHGNLLRKLYLPLKAPIIFVDPTTSELVKLVTNAHLHTLVSFWNQIDKVCRHLSLNSHQVASAVKLDPRISSYGAAHPGKKIKSRCLPKDLTNLINFCHTLNLNPKLLQASKEVDDTCSS